MERVELVNGKYVGAKDPVAVLDYTFDWTAYLDAIQDDIASAEFVVKGSESAKVDSSNTTDKTAVAWLSGGVAGETIQLDCIITTQSTPPRVDSRSMYLKVKDV